MLGATTTPSTPPGRPGFLRGRVGPSVRRHRVASTVVALLILAVAALDVRLFVVPISDHPAPTDAIVVLGGSTFSDRLDAALELARRYPGAALVASTPNGTPCPDDVVATSAVFCFDPDPSTTQGEARAAAALAQEHGWTSMTVVTTADHIWRARLRFSRCYTGNLRMVQAPTSWWVRAHSVPYEMGATIKALVFQRNC